MSSQPPTSTFRVDPYGPSKARIPSNILRPIPIEDQREFFTRLVESLEADIDVKFTVVGFTPQIELKQVSLKGGTTF
jgi:hypothetical protein